MTPKFLLSMLLGIQPAGDHLAPAADELSRAGDPKLVAFTIAWGQHESRLAERIANCECKRHECDARRRPDGTVEHLARGMWQSHRRGAPEWDTMCGDVRAQTRQALRHARWALRECRGDVRGAFAVLAGVGCRGSFRGIEDRVATFERVRRGL